MRTSALLLLAVASVSLVHASPYLRKPKRGFQVRATPFTVEPSQDLEVCEYRRLPNAKPMDVNAFTLRMPAGAHHFVLWAYGGDITDDSQFPQGPVPSAACSGLAPDNSIPEVLVPIQTPNARFQFPKGIALTIDPREQVWLNSHMRNGSPDPEVADIRFNFYRAKPRTILHHAQGLIIGNTTDISVPAGGDQTLTAEWTAPLDLTIIELATHQHHLGTYANIQTVDGNGIPTTIYENTDWEHPPAYWPETPLHLSIGQKLRITCSWHNTEDHTVTFGPKTTDEMCFILGFYYRDGDATDPVTGGGCQPTRRGLLCTQVPAITP